jgi:hypothetical protein
MSADVTPVSKANCQWDISFVLPAGGEYSLEVIPQQWTEGGIWGATHASCKKSQLKNVRFTGDVVARHMGNMSRTKGGCGAFEYACASTQWLTMCDWCAALGHDFFSVRTWSQDGVDVMVYYTDDWVMLDGDIEDKVLNETIYKKGPNGPKMPYRWTSANCSGRREMYLGGLSSHTSVDRRAQCRADSHAVSSPMLFSVSGTKKDPQSGQRKIPRCVRGDLSGGFWANAKEPCTSDEHNCWKSEWPFYTRGCWTNRTANPSCWLNDPEQQQYGLLAQAMMPPEEFVYAEHHELNDPTNLKHGQHYHDAYSKDLEWYNPTCTYMLFDKAATSSCLRRKNFGSLLAMKKQGRKSVIASDLAGRYGFRSGKYKVGKKRADDGDALLVEYADGGQWSGLIQSYAQDRSADKPVILLVESDTWFDWGRGDKEKNRKKMHDTFVAPLKAHRKSFHPDSQFVFVSPAAVHEFNMMYQTMPRAIAYRDLAKEVLRDTDWQVLDALEPTILRPEYRHQQLSLWSNQTGGLTFTLSSVLLNMVCA